MSAPAPSVYDTPKQSKASRRRSRTQCKDAGLWNESRKRELAQLIGHAPVCGLLESTPEGARWRDMPGVDEFERKVHFFFHRRGLMPLSADERGKLLTDRGHANRRRKGYGAA